MNLLYKLVCALSIVSTMHAVQIINRIHNLEFTIISYDEFGRTLSQVVVSPKQQIALHPNSAYIDFYVEQLFDYDQNHNFGISKIKNDGTVSGRWTSIPTFFVNKSLVRAGDEFYAWLPNGMDNLGNKIKVIPVKDVVTIYFYIPSF